MVLYFIHGLNGSAENWAPFLHYFSKQGFKCQAISLKLGMNLRKTHLIDYVNKVNSIVNEKDIVIGHSMGGLIMQKVAEQTNIKGGIGICPAPPESIAMKKIPLLRQVRYVPYIVLGIPFKPSFGLVKEIFLNDMNEEEQRHIYNHLKKQSAFVSFETMNQKIKVDEKKVSAPLHFIARNNDKTIPVEVVKKIARKYNAPSKVIEGNHYIFHDHQKIIPVISSFLLQIMSS